MHFTSFFQLSLGLPSQTLPELVPTHPTCMNYITKTYLCVCISPCSVWNEPWSFHLTSSTSGTSWACHSWRLGRWAHFLLYTSNSPSHTPRHTRRRHPSSAIPLSCTLLRSFLTLTSRRAANRIHRWVCSLLGEDDGLSFIWCEQFKCCQVN